MLRFFDGFTLVEPGLVYLPEWRPDPADDQLADPGEVWMLAAVGKLGGEER